MKSITSLAVLSICLGLAGTAGAQDAAKPDAAKDAPPAEAAPAAGGHVLANGMDTTADHMEIGRWYNADGVPTFKVENGVVDYAVFSGYRRYHSECHVCHGPDGEGSTYAPALKDSVLRMDYYDFQQIVASGKQDVNAAQNQARELGLQGNNVELFRPNPRPGFIGAHDASFRLTVPVP